MMRKRGALILFLVSINLAFAMDYPIAIEANEGDTIKIFVWPAEYGPALNIAKGTADEDGIYHTTFFSLNTPDVKYQITIYNDEGDLTHSQTFTEYGIDKPLKVDCTFVDKCVMSVMTDVELEELGLGTEEVAEVEENVTIEEENASENEVVESVTQEELINKSNVSRSESSLSLDLNSNIIILLLTGGILTFLILMLAYFKFNSFRDLLIQVNYFSTDAELARIEAQIKKKDMLIEKIKEKEMKEKKIKVAKEKLKRESEKLEKIIRKKIKEKPKK